MSSKKNTIRSSLAADPDYADLLSEFVSGLPSKCQMIEQFIAAGDTPQLNRIVHQIRGASGSYGFQLITEVASEIDEHLRAGKSIGSVAEPLQELMKLLKSATAQP